MQMNWRLFFFLSLTLLSGFTDSFTEDLKAGPDLSRLISIDRMIIRTPLLRGDQWQDGGHSLYGFGEVHEATTIITDNTLTNRQATDPEQTLLVAGKKKANLIRSLVATLVIIGVALLPKGIMIYYVWRKSRTRQPNEQNDTQAELLGDSDEEEIRNLAIHHDPLFLDRFRHTYPEFTRKLLQKHPTLLKSDFLLCAMVFLDFSSKEIATYTFLQHRSVQTKKSRLRKKMQLPPTTDLYQYLRSIA